MPMIVLDYASRKISRQGDKETHRRPSADGKTCMIELADVRKVFNLNKPNEFLAIDGVTLTIEANKATVFKGPSGSGKTTLLSLVGCMARPTSGRIRLMNREITSLPERFLTEIRRKSFGFIFQHFNLIKGISALENAMLPAFPLGEKHSAIKTRARELFELFNIGPKADAKAEWLSGGEAQRVAIVRALMNNPSVIIADEPTAHLDTKLSIEFMEILEKLKKDGKTLILASHDPLVYESRVIDRVVNIRDGRLDGGGRP
jgi:putative ABC transport system ATP-binding protein